ncbi:MAG: 16S rRNA (cytidine(1402)-2'-O)-methyltransferase [Alphaproteobacteria bacterium]|nr:16S rRNA (cytidine(1402)-2'-O)-methyltransferase [Alphaproteobacteria bacterium]
MKKQEVIMQGALYLVATPIGNLSDLSERARQILEKSEIIACEDTRTSRSLFRLIGLKTEGKTWIAYHNFNEEEQSQKILQFLKNGQDVALVSDAGSPLISDPGYKLVHACVEAEIEVFPVPGANAVLSALQVSGLPSDRFMFVGFLPTKKEMQEKALQEVKSIPATLIFYESPRRVVKTLQAMKEVFSNRQMALVREITKKFEEKIYGSIEEVLDILSKRGELKGEVVLVVDRQKKEIKDTVLMEDLIKEALEKMSLKEAVSFVASTGNFRKNDVYKKALSLQKEGKTLD